MSNNIIEIRHLQKKFKEKLVFDDLNLNFPKNKITVIYGKSGSGKSTLLRIISALEPYQAGEIRFNDTLLPKARSRKATRYRRDDLSFIFQDYGLVKGQTIKDNLLIGLAYSKLNRTEKEAQMRQALSEVGLDHPLNTKVDILSGGQQQRVAIARSLLKNGELVLADEPTGSLDSDNRAIIFKLFQKLKDKGKTVIIVSHDPYFEAVCDNVIRL